jgi:hypothetical protein
MQHARAPSLGDEKLEGLSRRREGRAVTITLRPTRAASGRWGPGWHFWPGISARTFRSRNPRLGNLRPANFWSAVGRWDARKVTSGHLLSLLFQFVLCFQFVCVVLRVFLFVSFLVLGSFIFGLRLVCLASFVAGFVFVFLT